MADEIEACVAKVGAPFQMTECGAEVEYREAGQPVYGLALLAEYTGWYHKAPPADELAIAWSHHAVPKSMVL